MNTQLYTTNITTQLQEIRRRKNGRTKYADKMRDKLNEKFDEME